jgi:DNA-directed RNA polymerase subunit F
LQSPTAVCSVRGSEIKFGYDSRAAKTLVYEKAGSVSPLGDVVSGYFEDLGIDAAQASSVYNKFNDAINKCLEESETVDPLIETKCVEATLLAAKEALENLLQNKHLSDEVKEHIKEELDKIEKDLEKIRDKILDIKGESEPTVTTTTFPTTTTTTTTQEPSPHQ